MSEYKQRSTTYVSPEEYKESRPWRASSEDVAEPARHAEEEGMARGRFIMRLLDNNKLDAYDQLVEVVGADSLGSEEMNGPLSVTVRPLYRG